jgi:hypothetical protein
VLGQQSHWEGVAERAYGHDSSRAEAVAFLVRRGIEGRGRKGGWG